MLLWNSNSKKTLQGKVLLFFLIVSVHINTLAVVFCFLVVVSFVFNSADHVKIAYKQAHRTRIRGRPILVDVERGRTVR